MSIALQVRQSQGCPENVASEIAGKSDLEIETAWQDVQLQYGRGESIDSAVKALEEKRWSYDSAYWFANQARIFAFSGPQNAKSYRHTANIISFAIVGGCALIVGLSTLTTGKLNPQAFAYGAGFGSAIVFPIRFLLHKYIQ